MSSNRLSLDFSAEVERPTFDLPDGGEIEFKIIPDFTPGDIAKAMRLQATVDNLNKAMKKGEAGLDAIEKLCTAMKNIVNMILPEMPEPLLDALSVMQMTMIVQFWRANNQASEKNVNGQK